VETSAPTEDEVRIRIRASTVTVVDSTGKIEMLRTIGAA
jgi:hypothetical protein